MQGPLATRPRQPADQPNYENARLFGAICPARGIGAALASNVDIEVKQLHLNEISHQVAKASTST
ncbi:hypothetical protein CQ14_24585 [Bradyrhizobium lablabi]|uniref:Uncharacterized protein n=1 Tax=Bradyrhizobium lablabi TaxID=722472 RepID=A0A0R3MFD9_9BRAD|nr:hypothetical protein CQ14_24585 [Bradyrhizobium lablabi]